MFINFKYKTAILVIYTGKVTISLSTCFFHPKTDSKEDIEAANRAIQFHVR